MPKPVVELAKDEAIRRCKLSAFHNADEDRYIIHSMSGYGGPLAMGCDMDLDAVIEEIEAAEQVGWCDPPWMGHALLTNRNNRILAFDVKGE